MLMLHYMTRERAMQTLDPLEAHEVITAVVVEVRERFRKLGHGQ
jgi:hypothetical protein